MKLLGKTLLDKFVRRYADARPSIRAWRHEVERATWTTPMDIKQHYSSASILQDNRVIFNIKGNNYRLDVKIGYKQQIVKVMRIGTHAEYDKWKF